MNTHYFGPLIASMSCAMAQQQDLGHYICPSCIIEHAVISAAQNAAD